MRLVAACAAVMIAALLAAATPSSLRAQISPGPLARAHRDLEGARNCTACHSPRREPMPTLCLACHKEIAQLLKENKGYHARVVGSEQQECQKCHPDHAGVDFKLISWPGGAQARFDHQLAGWSLEGKHADTRCEDCHATKFRKAPEALLSKRQAGAGWVGLETTCASCHRDDDQHRGSLGLQCDKCHDSGDWKRAPRFDHAATSYPLTGRHADVTCDKCHLSPRLPLRRDASGAPVPVYRPVPNKSCADCHEDPHRGRLSSRCSECHNTRGFREVDQREFNHGLTRYPLRGKHTTVACAQCHGNSMAKKDPPFATCAGCHADPHDGKATRAAKSTDCASCHRVEGFSPSTYTTTDHRSAPFVLDGKHLQVACASCHTPIAASSAAGGRARVARIRMPYQHCANCHEDAHGGQLAARADRGACESCHAVAGWAPSTFTAIAHDSLGFPLTGRHAAVACAACHAASATGLPNLRASMSLGTAKVKLALGKMECAGCHVDAHDGRYARGGAKPVDGGCRACHGMTGFRPSTVDIAMHARFTFALEGAHRAVPCVGCHEELKATPATSTLLSAASGVTRFPTRTTVTRATTCASCHEHESPHGTQFASRKDKGACESCHTVDAFVPAARFDHDRDATFPLAGAHANVACDKCHKTATAPDGARRVVYRPLSARCESCHKGTPAGGLQ